MHGKHTNEKLRAKLFETDQPNGCTDEENFCMNGVKRKNS